jgi:ankyrin repeat protein
MKWFNGCWEIEKKMFVTNGRKIQSFLLIFCIFFLYNSEIYSREQVTSSTDVSAISGNTEKESCATEKRGGNFLKLFPCLKGRLKFLVGGAVGAVLALGALVVPRFLRESLLRRGVKLNNSFYIKLGLLYGANKDNALYQALSAGNLDDVCLLLQMNAQIPTKHKLIKHALSLSNKERWNKLTDRHKNELIQFFLGDGIFYNENDAKFLLETMKISIEKLSSENRYFLIKAILKWADRQTLANLVERANIKINPGLSEVNLLVCAFDNCDLLECLVKGFHIDPNVQDREGDTALHRAVRAGKTQAINQLLALGARADIDNKNGVTPLHVAVYNGNIDLVRKFIAKPASIATSQMSERSQAELLRYDNPALLECLVKGFHIDPNVQDRGGDTALHRAVRAGKTQAINQLLALGVCADIRNNDGLTPLHVAVRQNIEVVKRFIDRGLSVDLLDSQNKTPLMHAAESGNFTTFKELVGAKANINVSNMQS